MLRDDDSDLDALLVRAGLGDLPASKPSDPAPPDRKRARPRISAVATAVEVELEAMLAVPPAPELRAIVDPCTLPVRFSRLKLFGKSAAHYFHACQEPDGEETLALRMGSGTHAMLFDQPCACFDGRRVGKSWAEFAERHAGEVILNRREWTEATAIAEAVKRNKRASALLFDDTIIEQRIDWAHIGNRACRSTPDARGKKRRHVVDLKSTRSAHPKWFSRDAWKLYYYAQLAFYGDAIEQATGVRPDEYFLVAVESIAPYPVTVFELDAELVEHGHKVNWTWFEELLGCEASGVWPEYSDHLVPMGKPEFARDQEPAELSIGGELVAIE